MTGIVRFVTAPAALQLVGADAVAGTTITVPPHLAGDLIVISAWRNGSTTPATLPGGWTNIINGGSDSNALRVGRLIATGTGTSSGTWTNATHLAVEVWRGVDPTTPIGASNQAGGTGDTISVPALVLQKADMTSVVTAGYGHTAATSFTIPDGMVERDFVGSAPRSAIADTDGGVPSWDARTVTASTSGGWRSASVEIRAKPVTVLDLNQSMDTMYVRDDDTFSLGAPEWEAEPNTVGGDDGYRTFACTVAVDLDYEGAAAAMSAVSRVLQRSDGWLMLQRDAGHRPFFLRWYRTAPQELAWELSRIDSYTLPINLTCDPYLYGEPITLTPTTVTNDPNAGTNRCFIRLAADTVKGDAPAPLKVDIVPSGDWHGYQPLMASAALESGQDQTIAKWYDLTAAGWTAGTDTGGDTVDATFVGGSYRLWTVSGTNMATRLSGTLTSPPPAGTYKVMLRVGTSTDNSTFAVRFGQKYNVTEVRYGDTKQLVRPDTTITAYATWMDLGEFTFPYGAGGLDAADIGGITAPEVEIQAQRLSGTANLRFDALMLIPVETAATIDTVIQTSRFHGFGIEVNRSGVWDGLKQRFMSYDFGVNLANLRSPELRGGWLRVTPGVVNVFHLLQQTQVDTPAILSLDDDDEIANTASVTFTYFPRYLHMRPDSG